MFRRRTPFMSCPMVIKISGCTLGASLVLQCVGIGTNYWTHYFNLYGYDSFSGLWQICTCILHETFEQDGETCICDALPPRDLVWLGAVQAMECLGVAAIFIPWILICAQIIFDYTSIKLKIVRLILVTIAGFATVVGAALYGIRMESNKNVLFSSFQFSYSFGLCIAAGILSLVTGCLLFSDLRTQKNTENRNRRTLMADVQITNSPQCQIIGCSQPVDYYYGPPPAYSTLIQPACSSEFSQGCADLPPPYNTLIQENKLYV